MIFAIRRNIKCFFFFSGISPAPFQGELTLEKQTKNNKSRGSKIHLVSLEKQAVFAVFAEGLKLGSLVFCADVYIIDNLDEKLLLNPCMQKMPLVT